MTRHLIAAVTLFTVMVVGAQAAVDRRDPAFRTVLVQQIVTLEIDPPLGDGAAPVIHVG